MPPTCTVCRLPSENRQKAEGELLAGRTLRDIAAIAPISEQTDTHCSPQAPSPQNRAFAQNRKTQLSTEPETADGRCLRTDKEQEETLPRRTVKGIGTLRTARETPNA